MTRDKLIQEVKRRLEAWAVTCVQNHALPAIVIGVGMSEDDAGMLLMVDDGLSYQDQVDLMLHAKMQIESGAMVPQATIAKGNVTMNIPMEDTKEGGNRGLE